MTTPVRYSPEVEPLLSNEREVVSKLNGANDTILKKAAKDCGRAVRSVHGKAHGILQGKLSVLENLPSELAQGLLSSPCEHGPYIRLSMNAGDILPDAISLPREFALRIVGLNGARLPDASGDTQDFATVNGPVFQAKTAMKFLRSLPIHEPATQEQPRG